MPNSQAIDVNRKSPSQARAKKTVETILEATAQILTEEGSERLTTNHLARRAGFSIGTLYQYFPNREAIVLALIERQREHVARRIEAVLANQSDVPAEEKIRKIIRVLHEAFNLHRMPERRLVQALLRFATARGLPSPPGAVAQAIVKVWMADGGGKKRPLNDSEVFVLNHAIVEVLRQATLQGSPLLGARDFEDAILRLVLGFLARPKPV